MVLWSHDLLIISRKTRSGFQIGDTNYKDNRHRKVKTITWEIFKQKRFPRIAGKKALQNSEEIAVVEFIFRKASEVKSLVLLKIDSSSK